MKKSTLALALITSLTLSSQALATGGKGGDPSFAPQLSKSTILISSTGGKGGDPTQNTGGKGGDPTQNTGGKGGDPEGDIISRDSGYPSLTKLPNQFFAL